MYLDARNTIRDLQNHAKQVVYATAVALNLTAEDANAALRRELPQRFHIRQPGLLRFVAPVQLPASQRATKQNLNAILKTEALGHILDPFETGIPKTGTAARPLAIPTRELRFTPMTVVPRRWYPSNLGLVARRDPTGAPYFALGKNSIRRALSPQHITRAGKVQIKGKMRTFVLDPALNRGITEKQHGVYVRIGPSRGDIRMIWRYTSKVSRPPILHFEEITRRVFAQRYAHNFAGALANALATAR